MFLVESISWTQMKITGFLRISNGANTDSGQFIDFDTDEECRGEGQVPIGPRF